ncbi:MAG: polyphosphate kinase 2 family protein [Bacteroidetes bacterium]|nr:polyphosphate kinase 2 family protein [Bacteroidota bacterium]
MKNNITASAFKLAPAPKTFHLKNHATRLAHKIDKDELKKSAKADAKRIGELQQLLYAENSRSLLLVFQAMDAAGKDSCMARVLRYVSPQGCRVTSYKAPSSEELDHDFLWRHAKAAPAKGMIGVHNRSHYEEVLVVRVHPQFLAGQHLHGTSGAKDPGTAFWEERYGSIRNFEAHLVRQGTAVMKFYLHMGREAQKKRFLERIEKREKNWKFNAGDLKERALWNTYMEAYESAIRATATPEAPWYIVPADRQWETRAIVCRAVREQLEAMAPKLPALDQAARKALPQAARMLRAEKP